SYGLSAAPLRAPPCLSVRKGRRAGVRAVAPSNRVPPRRTCGVSSLRAAPPVASGWSRAARRASRRRLPPLASSLRPGRACAPGAVADAAAMNLLRPLSPAGTRFVAALCVAAPLVACGYDNGGGHYYDHQYGNGNYGSGNYGSGSSACGTLESATIDVDESL